MALDFSAYLQNYGQLNKLLSKDPKFAENLKDLGNVVIFFFVWKCSIFSQCFGKKLFHDAVELYSSGLRFAEKGSEIYSQLLNNRASALLQLEYMKMYSKPVSAKNTSIRSSPSLVAMLALADLNACLTVAPTYSKALLRRGRIFITKNKYFE